MTGAPGSSSTGRGRPVLIGVLVALGVVFRLTGLDVQSLWHDELFSWYASTQPSWGDVVRVGGAEDVHPPAYYLLLRSWVGLFGTEEVALRGLSALAGIASLPLFLLLGRRFDLGPRTLGWGALAWMPIYYSQEARAYAFVLLVVLGLAVTITDPRAPTSVRTVLVGGLAAAAAWLHYFGLLFAALALPAWGAVLWRRGQPWSRAVVATVLACVLYLPWIATLETHASRERIWIPPLTWGRFVEVIGPVLQDMPGVLLVLWGVGVVLARDRAVFAVGAAWLVACCGAAAVVSWTVLPVVTSRNLIIVVPAVALLTAAASASLDRRLPVPAVSALLGGYLLVDLLVLRAYPSTPTKPDYRGVATLLAARQRADEPVLADVWTRAYLDYHTEEPLPLAGTRTGPRARRPVFAAGPPVVHVAVLVKEGRPRCAMRERGYRADCEQLTGWDVYRFERMD
jgi:uncharacterized membrane protein